MALRRLLSDALIGTLKVRPGEARKRLLDARVPGLWVEVSARHKRFVLRFRGRYMTLGRWPIMGTDEARMMALDHLRSEASKGRRDRAAMPTVPSGSVPTLRAVLVEYSGLKGLKETTARDYRRCLERYWGDYLEQPLTAIDGDVFLERFRCIPSPAQANYSLRILRALFRFHNAAHDAAIPIPTAKALAVAGAYDIRPRSRIISDDQQREWYRSVMNEAGPTGRDLFLFIACTGLRLGEALSLGREDKAPAKAAIEVLETKNGRPHTLPLGRRMEALLEARKGLADDGSGRVFQINQRNVRKAVAKVLAASSQEWSCHDLRRGFASLATRLNIPDRIVKRLLNHAEADVTGKHYIHIGIDALRPYMQAIEDAFFAMWKPGRRRRPAQQ